MKDLSAINNNNVVVVSTLTELDPSSTSILESNKDVPVYAAVLEGTPLDKMKSGKEGILIIGNESKGIHPSLLDTSINKVTIPRKGGAESLNAAVATGILLSHLT